MIHYRQKTYLQLLPDILSDDALIFVKRMYPINYAHSKLWPFHWTKTTWSFRKMANATSVTLIILWMFLQNIRLCTISSALTKKNKSSYERALKPFCLFYCLLAHTLSPVSFPLSLYLSLCLSFCIFWRNMQPYINYISQINVFVLYAYWPSY